MTRITRFYKDSDPTPVILHRPENIRYFTGFTGEGAAVIHPGGCTLITDFRYIEQAERQSGSAQIVMTSSDKRHEKCIAEAVMSLGDTALFEDDAVTVQTFEKLRDACEGVTLTPAGERVSAARAIKDALEIESIRKAAELTDRAFTHMLGFVRTGLTEWDVKVELDYFFVRNGAEGDSFSAIIASGENGSLPHAEPGKRVLKNGDMITMDFGCRIGGYCSDFTRTIALGKPCEDLVKVYGVVSLAQAAALEAVQPGRTGKEIDAIARDIIAQAGYGDRFGHGLGHGVGLLIHEPPTLSMRSEDVLEPGMVVTVEPGIYLPGIGGVRIEDLVVVTAAGADVLSKSDKAMIML